MGEALRNLNYDGTFVYQHGSQLSAMRIIHGVTANGERERLISLTGAPREVIKNNDKVLCILPDTRSVIVEKAGQSKPGFPHILPQQIDKISDVYRFQLGRSGRISGRAAQQILILPRDEYRYSYHIWIDNQTGMLLKADLRNNNHVIEQFMFTSLEFPQQFDDSLFTPNVSQQEFSSYRYEQRIVEGPRGTGQDNWEVQALPKGFALIGHQNKYQNKQSNPLHQLVYSDGLSTVSVFIEALSGRQKAMQGAKAMGAVNSYSTELNGLQITAVGEVPEATVRMISESVRYKEASK
ncbi:MAG: MucB/RseB C-terminal domain-containing protein [Gammaproteobacteria bacterium]|nr:MucB/RseB C-terminal domain-containing protein [Gammaproteobacteria bacterium]